MILLKRYADRGSGPSHKELWKKITAAKKLVKSGKWLAVDPFGLSDDLDKLAQKFDTEVETIENQTTLLTTALEEVTAWNYDGGTPPTDSTAPKTQGLKLWIFRWESKKDCFGKSVMYLKFCVDGTGEQGPLWLHSLHIDNPPLKG